MVRAAAEIRTERDVLIEMIARIDDAVAAVGSIRAAASNALAALTSHEHRPFRVVGSDDVEVAYGRFVTRAAAENRARGMNDLRENWSESNKRCRPPYRVQELRWEDAT